MHPANLMRTVQQFEHCRGYYNQTAFFKLVSRLFRSSLKFNDILKSSLQQLWLVLLELCDDQRVIPSGLLFQVLQSLILREHFQEFMGRIDRFLSLNFQDFQILGFFRAKLVGLHFNLMLNVEVPLETTGAKERRDCRRRIFEARGQGRQVSGCCHDHNSN